ncbi:MAG: flavodoxin family protein [Candidatus Aminicenantales bacterium]
MAKVLVTYYSLTQNTKKVAEAIYSAVPGDKLLKPIDEAMDLDAFGLIFVGFPVHSHSVPYKVELFLKRLPAGKKVALFSTHGSLTGMRLSREALEYASVLASHIKLLGTFACRGKVSLSALDLLGKSPEHEAWTDMAVSANTHPDAQDLEDAKSFAKWIVTLSGQSGR